MLRLSPLLLVAGGLFVLSTASPLFAQSPSPDSDAVWRPPSEPAEWGEVPTDLLRARSYPADSNAAAVVISDMGSVEFRSGLEVELEHHRRVKILTEAGYDEGTVIIPYYVEDRMQRVHAIDGVTYTLDVDGSIVERELDGDDIFVEERSENWEQIRFTLPNLAPGAVIEYRYKLRSESFLQLPSWSFQAGEPTLYSAYSATIPSFLEFVTLTRGNQSFTSVDDKDVRVHNYGDAVQRTWVMTDVKALREEPFATTVDNFRSRLQLQFSALRNPRTGWVEQRFLSSWPETAEHLLDANYFGDDLGDGRRQRRQAEALVAGLSSDAEKIEAIHQFVRTAVAWDGRTGWALTQDLNDVLEARQGSAAEVNLLLVSLLRHAGVDAHPALASTRNHGQVTTLYPILDQFNYVLAAVQPSGSDDVHLLDATDPYRPSTLLPPRVLNQQAWVVREKTPVWVSTDPSAMRERSVFAAVSLDADGTVTGATRITDDGYAALSSRKALAERDEESFARDAFLTDIREATIDSIAVTGRDASDEHLRTDLEVTIPAHAQRAGDMLYFTPILYRRFESNPFRSVTRTFPVDFGAPDRTIYSSVIEIPDGYAVEELPENRRVRFLDDAGSFLQLMEAKNGRISIRSVLSLDRPVIHEDYYSHLRTFVDYVVSAQSEPIVLRKIRASEADDASE